MARLIEAPTVVPAVGEPPKRIEEYVGHANTPEHAPVSVARMVSPEGWSEPGQRPEFDEFTVGAGQAVVAEKGEWVRYSTPDPGGAEYVAVCLPAFSPDTVHRDDD